MTENTGSKLVPCRASVCSVQPAQISGEDLSLQCDRAYSWLKPLGCTIRCLCAPESLIWHQDTKPGNLFQSLYYIVIMGISSLQLLLYSHKFFSGCNSWSIIIFLKLLALLTLHQIKSCLWHPVFCNTFFLQSESLKLCFHENKTMSSSFEGTVSTPKSPSRTNWELSEKNLWYPASQQWDQFLKLHDSTRYFTYLLI